VKRVVEHNDRTTLSVAEPSMGKSTFLSYMAHEIKKGNPSIWVLRINVNEHTNQLKETEFEKECIHKCQKILWIAVRANEPDDLKVTKKKISRQALEQTGIMVKILDFID
jgi:transcription termination factor Rho